MSIDNINDYIKFKILEYEHFKFINNNLQKQYKEDFADFTEAIFKTCNLTNIYNLQTLLHSQGVQVKRDRQFYVSQSLYNTLCKEDLTEQTKEEIQEQIRATRPFTSFKLNRISGLVANPLNKIQAIGQSGFRINLTGQSTPKPQVTDRNRI